MPGDAVAIPAEQLPVGYPAILAAGRARPGEPLVAYGLAMLAACCGDADM